MYISQKLKSYKGRLNLSFFKKLFTFRLLCDIINIWSNKKSVERNGDSMRRYNLSYYNWVIMSAKAWISGKPSIQKIIKENQHKSTIMVVMRNEGIRNPTPIFVLGSRGNYGNVGECKTYIKDTGIGYRGDGECQIQNIITIDENGIVDPGNGIGVNEKRTLYVFK